MRARGLCPSGTVRIALMHVAHEYGVAILFVGALLLFCMSLIDLARETRIALHDSDLRM
jgi:hypothetical protein